MNGDEVWKRDEIESPCVSICVIHPGARICVGCFRTGDEIAAWSRLTPAKRREIMAELPSREARLTDAGAVRRRGARPGGGPPNGTATPDPAPRRGACPGRIGAISFIFGVVIQAKSRYPDSRTTRRGGAEARKGFAWARS